MKRLIVLTISLLALTACNLSVVNDYSYEEIIDNVLLAKVKHTANEHFEGYKYYLPKGMVVLEKNDLNTSLYYKGDKMYMYNDTLSYYYKEKIDYKVDKDLHYAKNIKSASKVGYLEIDKRDDKYYFNYVYNYSKIEGACVERNIKECLIQSSLMLASVEYNDVIIASFIRENAVVYEEKVFDIFKTKKRTTATLNFDGEIDQGTSEENNGLVEEDFIPKTETID